MAHSSSDLTPLGCHLARGIAMLALLFLESSAEAVELDMVRSDKVGKENDSMAFVVT